jgi:hypothetical protein
LRRARQKAFGRAWDKRAADGGPTLASHLAPLAIPSATKKIHARRGSIGGGISWDSQFGCTILEHGGE